MRAAGRGLQPLQRHGHCMFTLLAKMEEHADGDTSRKRPEVELPTPTLVVSYSPPTLPPLHAQGSSSRWPMMIATIL